MSRVARCKLPEGHDRAVTLVGDQLAAIIHDPVLLDQPALLEAAGSAAKFALENERLAGRADAHSYRSSASRGRGSCVRATRSGAGWNVTYTTARSSGCSDSAWRLQLLQSHIDREGGPLLEETEAELQQALAELRELARGIHPAVSQTKGWPLRPHLSLPGTAAGGGRGLQRAAAGAGRDGRLLRGQRGAHQHRQVRPCEQRPDPGRPHGGRATSRSTTTASAAPIQDGSGLRGLADRIAALNGQLEVESPQGGGTTITAEIPCTP